MGELEDEFITDPIDANRPTDKQQLCVRRVLGDEVVCVKVRQFRSSDPARHL